jgi:hypothetical protein
VPLEPELLAAASLFEKVDDPFGFESLQPAPALEPIAESTTIRATSVGREARRGVCIRAA